METTQNTKKMDANNEILNNLKEQIKKIEVKHNCQIILDKDDFQDLESFLKFYAEVLEEWKEEIKEIEDEYNAERSKKAFEEAEALFNSVLTDIAEKAVEEKIEELSFSYNIVYHNEVEEVDLLESEEYKNREDNDYFINKERLIKVVAETIREYLLDYVEEAEAFEEIGYLAINFQEAIASFNSKENKGEN